MTRTNDDKSNRLQFIHVMLWCPLHSELQKLHMCHSTVLASGCGAQASRVMSSLILDALHDPLYLRLGHRADCALHRPTSASPTPTRHHAAAVDGAELRPTLAAIFPDGADNTGGTGADEETIEDSNSPDRRTDEVDEETIESSPNAEEEEANPDTASKTDADVRRQHHDHYGLDATGYRGDAEDDAADDGEDYSSSIGGRASSQNGARRRSSTASSAIAIVRQVSPLLPAVAAAVASVLWTSALGVGLHR
jgi:hypothetical protein